MSTFTILWLLWLGAFLLLEGIALKDHADGDTLSETIWRWASIRDKSTGWRLRRFALLAFLAWLCAHFLTGGKF